MRPLNEPPHHNLPPRQPTKTLEHFGETRLLDLIGYLDTRLASGSFDCDNLLVDYIDHFLANSSDERRIVAPPRQPTKTLEHFGETRQYAE